jgi:hypothetical protein
MARNSPVMICANRHMPSSDPKIHQPLIVDAVGRTTRALFAILNRLVYFVWVYSLSCVPQGPLGKNNVYDYN